MAIIVRAGVVLWVACAGLACGGDHDGGSGGSSASASGSGGLGVGGSGGGQSTSTGTGGGGAAPVSLCPDDSFGSPLPANTTAGVVDSGYEFLEGPVWFAALGQLFFSNMSFSSSGPDGVPPATIHRLTPPASIDVFIDPIGSNGLAIDQDGLMVACTHDQRSISRIDPISGARSTVADQWMGMAFNSPNDAVVRSDGTIYFTDPNWQLGNRPQEINFEGVYRIRPAGTPELVDDGLNSPNGVALSPDETLLYVADDSNGNVWRYDVLSDGTTGTGSMFVTVPGADGMAMDCAGNLYVTSNMGVRVFDPAGSELGSIAVGDKPSNCAFGGSDRTTLFITAQDTLYSIELLVPGMP